MSKSVFRWLLVIYVIVGIMSAVPFLFDWGNVPHAVRQLETSIILPNSTPLIVFGLVYLLFVFGLYLLGVIGMFYLWPLARYIWIAGITMDILMHPFIPWQVAIGWTMFFGRIEALLTGGILVLIFAGPAKDLFYKRNHVINAEDNQS